MSSNYDFSARIEEESMAVSALAVSAKTGTLLVINKAQVTDVHTADSGNDFCFSITGQPYDVANRQYLGSTLSIPMAKSKTP